MVEDHRNAADFLASFVPYNDAEFILRRMTLGQIFCNQLGVIDRRSLAGELFRRIFGSDVSTIFEGEGVAGHGPLWNRLNELVGSIAIMSGFAHSQEPKGTTGRFNRGQWGAKRRVAKDDDVIG